MNLIIDIGNSRVKVAVMDHHTVVEEDATDDYSPEVIKTLAQKYDISRSIVSSTRGAQSDVVESVRSIVGHSMLFDSSVRVPMAIQYSTPSSLGRDRLAAAVGAREMFGERDMLIVDFGTAITIDLVSRSGGFEGGAISPGVMLRFRALHDFTASLPLCDPTHRVVDVARSTTEAIESGVMNGVCYEIEGYISRFSQKYDELSIIFVGGDAKFFEKRIKNTIFVNRELLFRGLNRILDYNAE